MGCIKVALFLICSMGKLYNILAADEIIDCSNQELVTSVFNDPIDLTLNGTIKVYENVSIIDILSTSNNEFELKYIDARLVSTGGGEADGDGNVTKNLLIFTTEHFHNYAKEQTAARISLKINLGCGSGKERIIVFFQPLKEGNYYRPVFSQPLYELLMPTPIFSGFDLTAFVEISAKDDDLIHNQINFTSITSSQHHISVGTKNVTSSDKKTYFANLTLDRIYLELPQQIEFVITATDNGIPPRSSNASVIIRSDPSKRLPLLPRFAEKLYKGTINVNFEMVPIHIQLTEGSYAPEVKFSLNGAQTQGYDMVDLRNGNVEITWNASMVNQSFIMQHKKWELELRAEHSQLAEFSVATIIVDLADFQSHFHFLSTYYDGQIDDEGLLQVTPIIFYPLIYKPDIEFSLLENPQNMFSVVNNGFQVRLQYMSNFTLAAFANDTFIKLTLKASWEQLSAITYVIIQLPERPANDISHQPQQMFEFAKPLYVGNITEAHELEMETIVLQTDANATQLREFQLTGEWSHLFSMVVINDSQVKLELNLTQDFPMKSPIIMVLQARQEDLIAYCSIVLKSPQNQDVPSTTNVFMAHSLIGRLAIHNGSQIISLDSIELKSTVNLKDYEFDLAGDVSQYFDMRTNFTAFKIDLSLRDPIPNTTVELKKILTLSVHARVNGSENISDTIMLFVELPTKECSVPGNPLSNPPIFSSTNYMFTTFTNTTGSLGMVKAYSTGSVSKFHYILQVENDILAQRLSVEPFTGELLLYGSIDAGSYSFNVTAENTETQERAYVQAMLKVTEKEECKIFNGVAVQKTLVIKHIDEEMPHHGLWNMKFNGNCTFRIVEMWPKDKEYVYVNESSDMLDILAVDREDPMFADMLESQILVKLKLTCGEQDHPLESNGTQLPRSLDLPDMIYTQDIVYSPDTMWLHLIINDINDNAPQFKEKYSLQYLGYPAGMSVLDIYPEYLVKIEATDRDVGVNAKISYSMRNNAYFAIEPETGKIYPRGRVLQPQQQTELIILATDQDGKGLISGTVVIVKGLSADFYSLITLRENSSKSLEEVTQELRQKTGYEVRVIKMSYIPEMQTRSGDSQGLVCKAWIYAYRDQQLVQCKELQEKFLDKTPVASIVNIESYEEAGLQSTSIQKSPSTVGYIVAVALLSLVSATSIIFIIWRFYYYGQSPFHSDTKGTLSAHRHHQQQQPEQQHHGNGQQISTECSHGVADNRECTACNNYSKNHVKFSSLVENLTIEDCEK